MNVEEIYDALLSVDEKYVEEARTAFLGEGREIGETALDNRKSAAERGSQVNRRRLEGLAASVLAAVLVLSTVLGTGGVLFSKPSAGKAGDVTNVPAEKADDSKITVPVGADGSGGNATSKPMVWGWRVWMATPKCVANGEGFTIECAMGDDEKQTIYQLPEREVERTYTFYWVVDCKEYENVYVNVSHLYAFGNGESVTFFDGEKNHREEITFEKMKTEFVFDMHGFPAEQDPAELPYRTTVPAVINAKKAGQKGLIALGFGRTSVHDSVGRSECVFFYCNGEYVGFGATEEDAYYNSYLISDPARAADRGPVTLKTDEVFDILERFDRVEFVALDGDQKIEFGCITYDSAPDAPGDEKTYYVSAHYFGSYSMFRADFRKFFPGRDVAVLTIDGIGPEGFLELHGLN